VQLLEMCGRAGVVAKEHVKTEFWVRFHRARWRMNDSWKAPLARVAERVYGDALAPSVKNLGKALDVSTKAINYCLDPLRAVVALYEPIREDITRDVEAALKRRGTEKICPPNLRIAGPAIAGIAMADDEPEIKELFAELLAASIDEKTTEEVHPSFVLALQGMTSLEASMLRWAYKNDGLVFVTLEVERIDGERYNIPGFSPFWLIEDCTNVPQWFHRSIDNLRRLQLVYFENEWEADDEQKAWLREAFKDETLLAQLEARKIAPDHHGIQSLNVTSLGWSFCYTCMGELPVEEAKEADFPSADSAQEVE
jgi:hypothetical protein